jgi:hypothetical protein
MPRNGRDPLGTITRQISPTELLPITIPATSEMTHADYIYSIPTWYQRLLYEYQQLATDVVVWHSFRARKRLIIASDGSL